jgi:hypothetical protein
MVSLWLIIGITIYLVGGLEHEWIMTSHILRRIIPTDELIFFRGVETTNQVRKLSYIHHIKVQSIRNISPIKMGDPSCHKTDIDCVNWDAPNSCATLKHILVFHKTIAIKRFNFK